MKLKELKELQTPELVARVSDIKKELLTLRFQLATGQVTNGAKKRELRKEVARILTVLKERELASKK